MTEPSAPALVLLNRHTSERLELRRLWRDGTQVLELRGTLDPHSEGPPLHVHHEQDEEGVIHAGVLTATIDGRVIEVAAGGTAHLPRGSAHRWRNAHDEVLAFTGYAIPASDLDRFLQAIFEVMNAGPPGRPSLIYLAHVLLRHRRTHRVLMMPRPIQAVVLRLAWLAGTLTGRYRGTDWPGCPARCTGAPEPAGEARAA